MPRAILPVLLALATVLASGPAVALGAPVERTRVIVVLKDGSLDPGAVAAALGRANDFAPELVYRHAIRGFAATVPAGRLAALRADPRVAYVDPDQVASIAAQSLPTGVQRIDATANTGLDIDGTDDLRVDVDVAVIDSGIDATHPDLNVVAGVNCTGGGPFGSGSCATGQSDGNGHGTHVAGTIGALDNGVGVVGVAPGARLWAVKVLGSNGSGYFSWIVAGIDYVYANRSSIEVANMSLGCACYDQATATAISNTVAAGVTFAVAAGNSATNVDGFFPANISSVIAVSAVADFDGRPGKFGSSTCRSDEDDTLANFSNYGSGIDMAAPGVCILSTWPGGYNTISGTSMASPHVAGAAALLKSGSPGMTPAQVRSALRSAGTSDWTDESGDGTVEPLLNVRTTTIGTVTVGGGGGGVTPPTWVAIADLDATTSRQKNGWTARFTALVKDSNGSVVSGAVVRGTASAGGASGAASCTTGAAGTCTIGLSKLTSASASFTVSGITGGPATYDATMNDDPDADSDGTTITVAAPLR